MKFENKDLEMVMIMSGDMLNGDLKKEEVEDSEEFWLGIDEMYRNVEFVGYDRGYDKFEEEFMESWNKVVKNVEWNKVSDLYEKVSC